LSEFAAALVFPQWQGAGARKGYAAGTALLETLIPDDLPRAWVTCGEENPATTDGVKGLADLVAQAETARHLLAHLPPGPILTLGGDCAADLMPILHARDAGESDMALIYLDAHADLNVPSDSPSGHFHGMVVRTLLGEGPAAFAPLVPAPLRADQVHYVSARERDPGEDAMLACGPIHHFRDDEPIARLAEILRQRRITRLYLHLDLDILDPEVFPFIGVPAAHGWQITALTDLLAALRAEFAIAGAAITELNLERPDAAGTVTARLRQILHDGFGLKQDDDAAIAG
jgi:arginase